MKKGGKLEGWKVEKLGDVCEVNPRRPVIDRPDTKPTTFVPMSAVDDVHGVVARPEQRPFASVKKGYTFFTENDIIFAKITPCMENGKQAIARNLVDKIGFGSTEFHVIRPNEKIMAEWIWYFVRQSIVLENATKFFTGTVGQQRVPDIYLKSLEIPIPPLPEQQRIVHVLDEAFASIAQAKSNAERNLVNARELFEALLNEYFGHPRKGWKEMKLNDACIVERGSSPRPIKKYQTTSKDGVNWIKIGDTKGVEKYIYSTKEKITKEGAEHSRFVKEGDFILTNSMSFGNPYIMKTEGYIHDGWFVLRLKEFIDTEFFWFLLVSPFVRNQFNQLASGAIVKNISGDLVKKAVLFIPPLAEQRAIVGRLEALSAETKRLEEIYQQKVESLEELKKSVLGKAFGGEL
jgi:type I restriction enzyme S subunit